MIAWFLRVSNVVHIMVVIYSYLCPGGGTPGGCGLPTPCHS